MDARQQAALASLSPGVPVAWLVVYEDGSACVMRDDGRSLHHAASARAVRVPLAPLPDNPRRRPEGPGA